jgi:hypothetical protein
MKARLGNIHHFTFIQCLCHSHIAKWRPFLTLQLSVVVSDTGVPSLTSSQRASVIINVIRNQFPPNFINTPYATTVNRTIFQGTTIFTVSAVDQDTQVGDAIQEEQQSILSDSHHEVVFCCEGTCDMRMFSACFRLRSILWSMTSLEMTTAWCFSTSTETQD